ncbi:MAG: hypothetical protein ACI35R_15965 [Bacillus sp. (in: firmicutes)]
MMQWAILILFAAAVVLLILSIAASKKAAEEQKKDNELLVASFHKETTQLQEQIQDINFDLEILAEEAALKSTSEERILLRQILDLHRRKYSNKSIAEKTNLTEAQIETLLAPYKKVEAKKGNL